MRSAAMRSVLAGLAVLLPADPVPGGERPARMFSSLQPSSPCAFFRDQAFGKGLGHFSTEMLWACEAIALRRGAGVPLGERLGAVEVALARYHDAFAAGVPAGEEPAIARSSGALEALRAISAGF